MYLGTELKLLFRGRTELKLKNLRWIVPVFLAWEVWWLARASRFIPTSHARDLKSKTTWRRSARLLFFNLRTKFAFNRSCFNKNVLSKLNIRQWKRFRISLLELQKQNSHVCYDRACRRSWVNSTLFVSAYLWGEVHACCARLCPQRSAVVRTEHE